MNIRLRSIRFRIDSDSFGLKVYCGIVRINSDRSLCSNRIERDEFSSVFQQTGFKTFFGLVRIGFGMNFYPRLSPGNETSLIFFFMDFSALWIWRDLTKRKLILIESFSCNSTPLFSSISIEHHLVSLYDHVRVFSCIQIVIVRRNFFITSDHECESLSD